MRHAGKVAREVMDAAAAVLKPGVSGDDVDKVVFEETVKRNGYPSPLNYSGFPKSVCVSVNEVICHGIPDSRPLENGDICNLDITVYVNGHHADFNETYLIGDVDEQSQKLAECSYNCLKAAVDMVKPGVLYRDVGDVITKVAQSYGFTVVTSYCGHGVHRLFHTAPNVPHYKRNKATGVMREGHTFTIEPMINAGTPHDVTWPDGWTAVTADGKRSAQYEHTLLVTKDGVEILTALPGTDKHSMVDWEVARGVFAKGGAGKAEGDEKKDGESESATSGGGGDSS
jgi:methionyl aminopeptidase